MIPNSRGPEQALTILAIATAVVGFGLFRGDFFDVGIISNSLSDAKSSGIMLIGIIKFPCALMVMGHYLGGFASTRKILLSDHGVTGKLVADGPLTQLFWQVFYLALIFILDAAAAPLRN